MEEVIGGFTSKKVLSEANTVEICLPENPDWPPQQRFFLVGELLTAKSYRKDSLISTLRGLLIHKGGQISPVVWTAGSGCFSLFGTRRISNG